MPFDTPTDSNALITPINAANLQCRHILGRGRVEDLAWGSDGAALFAATTGGVWRYLPDLPAQPPEHWTEQLVTSIALAPADSVLALADPNTGIQIWDLAERQVRHTLPVPDYIVRQLCFSPDGRWLVAAGTQVDSRVASQ